MTDIREATISDWPGYRILGTGESSSSSLSSSLSLSIYDWAGYKVMFNDMIQPLIVPKRLESSNFKNVYFA